MLMMVKVMKRSPGPSALAKCLDETLNATVLRGATLGSFILPLSMMRPSRAIVQLTSYSLKSLKKCLLKILKEPVDAFTALMLAGAAIALNSAIAGLAVRSGKTIPSQQKLPSCFFSP